MSDIHFLRPYFLYLIAPAALLFFFLYRRRHAGIWQAVCSKDLIPHILIAKTRRHRLTYFLTAFPLLLLIIALAGPAWQQIAHPLIKQQTGLVIALDLSPAMDAQDIKPSRLQRAIYKVEDLLAIHKEGQIALIAFSADPFIVTPLTDDVATIKNLLPALDTTIMPSHGHRTHLALNQATALLEQAGISNGSILLITAELSDQETEAALAAAAKNNVKICVLGVGTETLTPIPKPEGGFVKNKEGALVMAGFSEKNLNRLAQASKGIFTPLTLDDSDLKQLTHEFSHSSSASKDESSEFKQNKWHDQGYLFVLLALPFASLLFRKGALMLFLVFMSYSIPAVSFEHVWQTKNQQAQQLFQQEKYEEAHALFESTEWKAACCYQLKDYEQASQLFKEIPTAEGLFNYGTSRAKLGDFESALQAYDNALELQPDHADAIYNKGVIEEFLKDQEKQKNSQDSNTTKEQNQNKKNDSEKENNDKQDQQEQQSENGDQSKSSDAEHCSNEENRQESNKNHDSSEAEQQESGQTSKPEEAEEQDFEKLKNEYQDRIEKEIEKDNSESKAPQTSNDSSIEKQDKSDDPQRHIDEQWLKRIQDDPAGLLRRKFLQQYRKQQQAK